MANKFTQEDIYQAELFKNLTQSLKEARTEMVGADADLKKLSASYAEIATKTQLTSKGVAELTETNKKSKAALTEQEVVLNKIAKIERELKNVTDLEREALAKATLERTRANKAAKEAAILSSKNSTLYEKESVRLEQMRRKLKDLALAEGEGARATKKMAAEVQQLDAKLKRVDASAGQFNRSVGGYKQAIGGAVTSLKNLAGALGVVGGVQLLSRVMKDAFNIVKNFDQAQANLASVLGVSRDQMAKLTEQAKELGATTKFTASQVSELQLEYAKLGFTQSEIENVTEATLQLAAAAGTDLANAATITGATIRGFGMDTTETQRVVDVMAKSFSSSSLDISKFQTSMAAVAPVAKAAGVSLEKTTALIGTLTDRGIDASTAGTGLRNMFLKSTQAGLTFNQALDEINNASDKSAKSLELFGLKGATLGVILAENQKDTASLTRTLQMAGGAAQEMADKQLDTLQGALDLLRSAWEGYILGADGASGISDKLKTIIRFLADNLEKILDTLFLVIKAYTGYRAAMKAVTLAQNAFGKSLTKTGLNVYAIALGAILLTLKAVYDEITKVDMATAKLNKRTEEINESVDKEVVNLDMLRTKLLKTTVASKERGDVLKEINAAYGTTLTNIKDEAEFLNQVAQAYRNVTAEIRHRISTDVITQELVDFNLKLREAQRIVRDGKDNFGIYEAAIVDLKDEIKKSEHDLAQLNNMTGTFGDTAGRTTRDVGALGEALKALNEEQEKNKKTGKGRTPAEIEADKMKLLAELRRKNASELLKLENDLVTAGEDRDVINQALFEKRKSQMRDEGTFIIDLDLKTNDELIKHRNDYLKFVEANEIQKVDLTVKANDEIVAANLLKNVKLEKQEQKFWDKYKKQISDALKSVAEIFKEVSDIRIAQIDREIAAKQQNIDQMQTEQTRLKELAAQGDNDAAAALIAEEKKIAREKESIEALENKKKNLLLTVVALERASQLIGEGNSNPFGTAGSELGSLLSKLPKFFDGTETTVAAKLGNKHLNTSKDAFLARLDGKESVLTGDQYSSITKANGYQLTTDEITRRAMMNVNRPLYRIPDGQIGNSQANAIIKSNKEVVKAIEQIQTTNIDPERLFATITKGNKQTNKQFTSGFRFD